MQKTTTLTGANTQTVQLWADAHREERTPMHRLYQLPSGHSRIHTGAAQA